MPYLTLIEKPKATT